MSLFELLKRMKNKPPKYELPKFNNMTLKEKIEKIASESAEWIHVKEVDGVITIEPVRYVFDFDFKKGGGFDVRKNKAHKLIRKDSIVGTFKDVTGHESEISTKKIPSELIATEQDWVKALIKEYTDNLSRKITSTTELDNKDFSALEGPSQGMYTYQKPTDTLYVWGKPVYENGKWAKIKDVLKSELIGMNGISFTCGKNIVNINEELREYLESFVRDFLDRV